MKWKELWPAVVVIIAAAVGVTWYMFLREPDPAAVLKKSTIAMQEIDSLHYDASITAELDFSGVPDIEEVAFVLPEKKVAANLLLAGDVDMNETKIAAETAQGTFDFYLAPVGSETPIFTTSLETREVDRVSYFRATKLNFLMPIPIPIDFSAVVNKWYSFEGQKLLHEFDKKKEEITGKAEPARDFITPEKREAIVKLLREADLYESIEKLESERIDVVAVYHYRFKMNPQETERVIKEILRIIDFAEILDEEGVDEFFGEFKKKLPDLSQEVWIAKKDFLVYRHTFDWPFVIDVPDEDLKLPIKISGTVKYGKFGVPVKVVVPAGAEDIQKLYQTLFGGVLGKLFGASGLPESQPKSDGIPGSRAFPLPGSSDTGTDVDSDSDGLTDIQETFWGTDAQNPDSDGDGFSDGDEVERGFNPNGEGLLFGE